MTLTKKRPTFTRLLVCVLVGVLVSGGLLLAAHLVLGRMMRMNFLTKDFIILAAISAGLIALLLLFPANRPARFFKNVGRLLLIVVLVAALWAFGGVRNVQNEMLYLKVPADAQAEQALSALPNLEKLSIPGPGGETYGGWLMKNAPGKAGLVLYFGGNGEQSASSMESFVRRAQSGLFEGYNLMMVDYPNYGRSTGETGEEGAFRMAQAAYGYALSRPDVSGERIVLAAWSLGTGTAVRLAAQRQPAGLILLAPYFSGKELVDGFARDQMHLDIPVPIPIRNPYKSYEYAAQYNGPALVVAARDDGMVAFGQSERLEARFPDAALYALETGGHSGMWYDDGAVAAIKAFLGGLLQPPPAAGRPV